MTLSLVALLPPALAEESYDRALEQFKRQEERFQLFDNCRPVRVVVDLDTDRSDITLATESVETMVESRMRAARLYDGSTRGGKRLQVRVAALGRAFHVRIDYIRYLAEYNFALKAAIGNLSEGETLLKHSSTAITWWTGSFGTHGNDPVYLKSILSEHLDKFIATYLRVNEEACGGP